MLIPTAKQKETQILIFTTYLLLPLRSPGSPSGFNMVKKKIFLSFLSAFVSFLPARRSFAAAEMQKLCATGSLLTSLFIFLLAPFNPRPSPFPTTAHSLKPPFFFSAFLCFSLSP
eukprot:gene4132-2974_t